MEGRTRHRRIRRVVRGHGGAAAAGRVPEPESHLRPGGGRRRGAHARRGGQPSRRSFRTALQPGGNVAAAKVVGELLAQQAKAAGIAHGRVRPRRLSVPRPGEGPGRRGARRAASSSRNGDDWRGHGGSADRSERAGAERPGGRHQPRGQGREGRPAVLLHRARGGGRRPRARGRRPGQGPRGARRRSARRSSTPRRTCSSCRSRTRRSRARSPATSAPARVFLKPAAQGTGVIAGGAVRAGARGGRGAGHPDQDAGHATTRTTCSRRPWTRSGGIKRLQDLHAAAAAGRDGDAEEAAGAKQEA